MNYSRHREAAKKALQEKQKVLSQMNGEDRTKAEKYIIEQAQKEPEPVIEEEKPKKKSKKAE
jgi:hypothetical protein